MPSAFWNRKTHIEELPYEKDFQESKIPTKARSIHMNQRLLEICKEEINNLLNKNLIQKSSSPWRRAGFYEEKATKLERGTPRLIINYKLLNVVIQWIRYLIPN